MKVSINAEKITTVVNADVAHVDARTVDHEPVGQPAPLRTGTESSVASTDLVFLVHNHLDQHLVLEVAASLESQGIRVWVDKKQTQPGRWYQDEVQAGIRRATAAIVFFGMHGVGPWQVAEIRAFLEECVQRGTLLVPALLPGVAEIPREFTVLRQLHCVRFQAGPWDADAIRALVEAVRKP
jgi:hypothetical protein